ncbi:hypothetical protein [Stenotrophomonas sp. NPDC077659]|uniref:hypothetical protein n=1 Tax=Stenotrophomonas sp. NPDC077659 TaxID=3390694 RepID=UPI003D00645F
MHADSDSSAFPPVTLTLPTYPSSGPGNHSATLVIADANPWVRQELGAHIRPLLAPQAVQDARSPSEVLMRVADPSCRMLVIDPCMPTLGQTDGVPLLRRICCLRRDLHILVLARHPQQLLRDKAFPRQIAHVHGKNIHASWLWRRIERALAESEAA